MKKKYDTLPIEANEAILNIITPKRIKAIIKIIGKKCNFIKT